MKMDRKPEYLEKSPDDELQKMPHTSFKRERKKKNPNKQQQQQKTKKTKTNKTKNKQTNKKKKKKPIQRFGGFPTRMVYLNDLPLWEADALPLGQRGGEKHKNRGKKTRENPSISEKDCREMFYTRPGTGIMEADDRQVTSLHSPTVIPPSALDKPSIMKRYHRQ